jgi:hypothetical protein
VVLALCTFGAIRLTRSSAAAASTPALGTPMLVSTADGSTNVGDRTDIIEAEPPLVMELPPSPSGEKPAQRTRGSSKGGKPHRPKFLNSRE